MSCRFSRAAPAAALGVKAIVLEVTARLMSRVVSPPVSSFFLDVHDGIRVNRMLETEDAAISSIGGCASFACGHDGVLARLESVRNAVDQAKCVSRRLIGPAGADHHEARVSEDGSKLAVCCFRLGDLIGVETVNAAGNHIAARKLLALNGPAEAGRASSLRVRPARLPERSASGSG